MNIYGQGRKGGWKPLQNGNNDGKLIVRNGRVLCPVCGKGVLQYDAKPGMVMLNVPRKCKKCGQTTVVNIDLSLRL